MNSYRIMIGIVLGTLTFGEGRAEQWIRNPLRADQEQAPVRVESPANHQGAVMVDGEAVPSQWERTPSGAQRWILADVAGGHHARVTFSARPEPTANTLHLRESGDVLEFTNGVIVGRVPLRAEGSAAPPPISGIRLREGDWLGEGFWRNAPPLESYELTVSGRGPVQITLLQAYRFEGGGSLRLRIRLRPGRDMLEIEERVNLPEGTAWGYDPLAGDGFRGAAESLYTQHGGGAGQPMNTNVQTGTLRPGQSRMGDVLVFLLPRWSQAMDDGWMAAAANDALAVGAVTVRAGQWTRPHEGKIAVELSDAGDAFRLVMPGIRNGARMWWLRAAPRDAWETGAVRSLVMRQAMGELDKLNRHYILDGFEPGQTSGLPHPFVGDQVNPTGMWRQQARQDRGRTGQRGDFGDLVWSQGVLDPDYYGTPWYGWSVQNPNFWTDVIQRPLFRFTRLGEHPRFDEIRRLGELALRADLHHSITLPGGAGQECPGYQRHALQIWGRIQESAGESLGFDLRTWERFTEGEAFLVRSSQPDGGRHRRMIPHGDTHPTQGGPPRVDLGGMDPRTWTSEEFPGFGVILRNRPGTERETFVTFKAGPNRGHYHGDQLSLHWAADARPLMVDHHVSYNPRAGQEHMHNRLSFGTADMPWAVMDGHERLIAFETSDHADVAVGEVSSRRLRRMPKLPPEEWDQRWDRHELNGELRYQRAVVLLKGLSRDALVLCDTWAGPEALDVTFNAHVLGTELEDQGAAVRAGDRFTAIRIAPERAAFSRFDFEHSNGSPEQTAGVRWTARGEGGRFVTVLWPGDDPPAVERIPDGVRVGDFEVTFGEAADGGSGVPVRVRRGGSDVVRVAEVDYTRSQGDIGLFVPDAGYPFGPIPDWLSEQRLARPDWARELPGLLDPLERW
ncbi:MAG: hypothetical protein JJU05_13180 [Verrucomicrobia bacterium]|nr:hypothetical protein [Verrucomicrobiota bacterium]MCH8528944.1 hypothetical protein [Kiritimatiellia bacterium]